MIQTPTTYLFVGGLHDGKRMTVPDLPEVRLPVREGYERYRCEILHAGTRQFTVYVSPGMSSTELLQRLLDGYKPTK